MKNKIHIAFSILLVLMSLQVFSQDRTKVNGIITDAATNEALPFVNIVFNGKNVGTITDYNGKYEIITQWASDSIKVSFIGYKSQAKFVVIGETQKINFQLESTSLELETFEVVAKKTKYRNKNNISVELIKKVIANKKKNRLENLDYYTYDKYQKIELDLNNITEEFKSKKIFNKFQFIFDYEQVSKINDKPFLPIYLNENLSKIYFRKNPKNRKEYIFGRKEVSFSEYFDDDGIDFILDNIYQQIDLYKDNIPLLSNQFVSPISSMGPITYKYFIVDTVDVNGYETIQVGFQPRNKSSFAFVGNLYITNDDRYALIKVTMKVNDQINLNFVQDLLIDQEFEYTNDKIWALYKDEIIIDFNFTNTSIGMFGRKNVTYTKYIFDRVENDSIYTPINNVINIDGYKDHDEAYWVKCRPHKLSVEEIGVYEMIDTLKTIPAFKRTLDVAILFIAGYWHFGKFDLGPVNTFYSFNDVEGFRLRVGGRTSRNFSKIIMIEGYGLYGFKDERFKYALGFTYSLNKKPWDENPRHNIKLSYQDETVFPGMELQFINEDNFLLSFKRGIADQIYYYQNAQFDYNNDIGNGFSFNGKFKYLNKQPGGSLAFDFRTHSIDNITTSEVSGFVRFAPNEKYYQGMEYKVPVINKYPILKLTYAHSFDGLLGSDYKYDRLTLNFFKRFYFSIFGYLDMELEANKLWGDLPYPLLNVLRANQTYSYQLYSYNLMNFLEFVTDRHVSVNLQYFFNGYIMNKIPLVKHLKLRTIITFKGVYGDLRRANDPEFNPFAMLFPTDLEGTTTTFSLESKPYMEASIGIGNIFKFFRVDLVKRLNYLNNPSVQEYGIRARFKFDF
ncbi:MAG: carboxypeptidase-like regulatory domain-containing protein [Bacteroidetes bacterium]|nr:MAG: carboxypeptidase-like regulatory domain-containing protein [Bacteroidota bacterium]